MARRGIGPGTTPLAGLNQNIAQIFAQEREEKFRREDIRLLARQRFFDMAGALIQRTKARRDAKSAASEARKAGRLNAGITLGTSAVGGIIGAGIGTGAQQTINALVGSWIGASVGSSLATGTPVSPNFALAPVLAGQTAIRQVRKDVALQDAVRDGDITTADIFGARADVMNKPLSALSPPPFAPAADPVLESLTEDLDELLSIGKADKETRLKAFDDLLKSLGIERRNVTIPWPRCIARTGWPPTPRPACGRAERTRARSRL